MRPPAISLRALSRLAALTLVACLIPNAAFSAWPNSPTANLPVCTASGTQNGVAVAADGAGGVFLAWQDNRSGNYDVYVQRINAAGIAQWTANGVAVVTATGNQTAPMIVADGSGGLIVAWSDTRAGNVDIYAQKVSGAGATVWAANGVALCTATGDQLLTGLASDNAGGAIAAWQDPRTGVNDIYAQRITSAGAASWTANGVALCTAADDQNTPVAVADGAGGAIVVWNDFRSTTSYDIYAQRVNSSGTPQWTANGVATCTVAGNQQFVRAVADGAGGALLAWTDSRGAAMDIYAQHLAANGSNLLGASAQAVCTATGDQQMQGLTVDETGAAYVVWGDNRGGAGDDIYVQKLGAGGYPQWTADGVALCTANGTQGSAVIASDGAGGAFVVWQDFRVVGTSDLYAQRVSAGGSPLWATNGIPVCTALSSQNGAMLATTTDGVIVAWNDSRNITTTGSDIYAQRIQKFGVLGNPEPAVTAVRDVPNDQGGRIKVSWNASYLDADPYYGILDYRLWRSVPPQTAPGVALRRGVTTDPDEAARTGRLLLASVNATAVAWEPAGSVEAATFGAYSLVADTEGDSIGSANPRTLFMVEARAGTATSAARWFSAADSGYSVDNLAPAAPAALSGFYDSGATRLAWNPNVEPDLAGYRLYRGTSVGFVPGPGNLVSSPSDTGYVDAAGQPYVYKLTAVDVHGNESPVATLVPDGALDVPPTGAARFFLAPAVPTPARAGSGVTLRFGLSRAGEARLTIHDAAGRLVRTLAGGRLAAGEHARVWDARDAAGRRVAPGVYLARFGTAGETARARVVIVD